MKAMRGLAAVLIVTLVQSTQPCLAEATSWRATAEHDGVVYFALTETTEIARYDMASRNWAPSIPVADAVARLAVDDTGIFVAIGTTVMRMDLDGANPTTLATTSSAVGELVLVGEFVVVTAGSRILSIGKEQGGVYGSVSPYHRIRGLSVSPALRRVFGRSTGVSPSDIVYVDVAESGALSGTEDSPYHGDYPDASRTWVFPDSAQVIDSAGIVYTAADLLYVRSAGGAIHRIRFNADVPFIQRYSTLSSLSATLGSTGDFTFDSSPEEFFVHGDDLFLFYSSAGDLPDVERYPVDILSPPTPGPAVDPGGMAYTPDAMALGADGILYILSKESRSMFRWSVDAGRYLPSVALTGSPLFMAYAPELDRVFLAYSGGRITQIRLAEKTLQEEHFTNSPQTPLALAVAGQYVFVVDPSGPWVSHFTYDADGALISQKDWNYNADEFTWSATNRRMYFVRTGVYPVDLLWEEINGDGVITTRKDSPYHGSYQMKTPVRVSPDGTRVVLGSANVFDGETLALLGNLPSAIVDAVWVDEALTTIRDLGDRFAVETWTDALTSTGSFVMPGKHLRTFALGSEMLFAVSENGVPRFIHFTACGDCDDRNPCTRDTCNEGTLECEYSPNEAGTACSDGIFCNGLDSCDSAGTCGQHQGDPCQAGPECANTCNENAGNCLTPAGVGCTDNAVFCDGAEVCDGAGLCVSAGDPCDGPDGDDDCSESCDEANDNCNAADPNGTVCDDGLYCNGLDTCFGGQCVNHTGDPCAGNPVCRSWCDEASGSCDALPDTACDDGNPCTVADTCSGGYCQGLTSCGDGMLQTECDEECDDGNRIDGDGCSAMCTLDEPCGDHNRDGRVTITDALLLLRYSVGLDVELFCPIP